MAEKRSVVVCQLLLVVVTCLTCVCITSGIALILYATFGPCAERNLNEANCAKEEPGPIYGGAFGLILFPLAVCLCICWVSSKTILEDEELYPDF